MRSYYLDPRISQSQLKRFLNSNPRSLFRKRDEEELYYTKEKIHFSKGKLLDLILENNDINEFFYIESSDYKHPTPAVESIAQQCVDEKIHPDNIEMYDRIKQIKDEHNYQSRWKTDTTDKWIKETLSPIIKHKLDIGDRTVLSQTEYETIATIANSILYGEFTQPILEEFDGEYQVALYTKDRKALLDKLQIDHINKIIRIIDFKSTSDYLEVFPKSIKKFRYDIQLSYYYDLVSILYPDYKQLEPILIVGSTKEPLYAEPFTLSYTVLENAKNGYTDKNGVYHKGWLELIYSLSTYGQEMYNANLIENKTNYINDL